MSNFSSFFAVGKRVTFSLSYCGRETISFNSDEYTFAHDYELGNQLTSLVPQIEKYFAEICIQESINITPSVRTAFHNLFTSYRLCEYSGVEIYSFLAYFTLDINRSL